VNIFLVANGKVSNLKELKDIINPELIISVDGGTNKALKNKVKPDVIIGDHDSIRKKIDAKKVKFPKDKDQNDLDLAIDYILSEYKDHKVKLFCFGIIGNRLDHTLANIYSIIKINQENYPPVIVSSKETVILLIEQQSIRNIPANIRVSVLSLTTYSLVQMQGLKYSGTFEIPFLSSLGISNFSLSDENQILCKDGKIMVIVYEKFQNIRSIKIER